MKELRRLAGSLARDTRCQFYFDISPLLEERWTGIPVVAASLAQRFLKHLPGNTRFFFEGHEVLFDAVVDALRRSSGLYLQRDFFNGDANAGPLKLVNDEGLAVGVYPSVKRVRAFFPIECSVFHDVSTLITPQFHIPENIDYHMQTIHDDLRTNTVSACVSDATLTDIHAYFGTPLDHLVRSYNGVSWPDWYSVQAKNDFDPMQVEPYFLILGTREPRKNINKVLELLVLFSDVLETHRFVFVGKMGWLAEHQAVPERLSKAIEAGRILFTGFLPEFEKYKLLMGAEATIYPSFFEGFGLPVLESLSVGTPCIASYSSSIPEVGGDLCVYHDPFSVQDLYRAVREIQINRPKQDPAFRQRCRDWAAQFTWDGMLASILRALTPAIHAKIRETNPDFQPGALEDFDEKEPEIIPQAPVVEASEPEPDAIPTVKPTGRGRKGKLLEPAAESISPAEALPEASPQTAPAKPGRGRRASPPLPAAPVIANEPDAAVTEGDSLGSDEAVDVDAIVLETTLLVTDSLEIAPEFDTPAPPDDIEPLFRKRAAAAKTAPSGPLRSTKRSPPAPPKRMPRR